MIIIPKEVIQMVDRCRVDGVGMDIKLIDSTREHPEQQHLGINIDYVKVVWESIKKIRIQAGDAKRQPYKKEEQLFRPFDATHDQQIERFLEDFIQDKQVALHLGSGYNLCYVITL